MTGFNKAPFTGKEFEYIQEAIEAEHICGDGIFTKKCSRWLEERTGASRVLLTTSCTHATEMAALLFDTAACKKCAYYRTPQCGVKDCRDGIKKWLEQEAAE